MKRLVALVIVVSLALLSVTAFGRPGGGQSFSGSRSGSSRRRRFRGTARPVRWASWGEAT